MGRPGKVLTSRDPFLRLCEVNNAGIILFCAVDVCSQEPKGQVWIHVVIVWEMHAFQT